MLKGIGLKKFGIAVSIIVVIAASAFLSGCNSGAENNAAPIAESDVSPRGAEIPWVTYEAEDMKNNGTVMGPTYEQYREESEASGRKCVKLEADGAYVEFTAKSKANSIVVRYSIPDAPEGNGINATLGLYKNGKRISDLPMTSKYSWLYGTYPWYNTAYTGSPRNFYDEVRLKLDSINSGDVIRLQKDSSDTAQYYIIDLVDLEDVPAPLTMPEGFMSVTDFGAVADDANDDTEAIRKCFYEAKSKGKGVWVPAGTFRFKGTLSLYDATIRGAGMWHTTFLGDDNYSSENRIRFNGSGNNVQLSDFAIIGKLNYRDDGEPNDGLVGSFGTGSTISNIWVEHTKVGGWIVNSEGLVVKGCRFRNTIADGINYSVGMKDSTIENCTTRGTGDDCFAMWPAKYATANFKESGNVIKNCTAQLPWLAHGVSIYGGENNRVEDCEMIDICYGAGVLISTTFEASDFSGTTVIQRNDIIRCAGNDIHHGWQGGVQIFANNRDIKGLDINNLNIVDPLSDGIHFANISGKIENVKIDSVTIKNPGITGYGYGIYTQSGTSGSAEISNTSVTGSKKDGLNAQAKKFTINMGPGNSGWGESLKNTK